MHTQNEVSMSFSVSLVVTCKDRLSHLQQTLPTFLAQSFSKIIVIDYACSQGSSDWVRSLNANVILKRVDDDPNFCLSRARNASIDLIDTDFILFIDADVKLRKNFDQWIRDNVRDMNSFFVASRPCDYSLYGTLLCPTVHFQKVGMYDEVYRAWGGEDTDLYLRLGRLGLQAASFPCDFLDPISHGDDMRRLPIKSGGMGSKSMAMLLAKIYREIKLDIEAILNSNLDINYRKKLMADIRSLLFEMKDSKSQVRRIDIQLPPINNPPVVKKTLNYLIKSS
jgi:glycosyltransferase involved in cell wall biosynthesis